MTEEEKPKSKPVCTDLCEYCTYIECGDFVCNLTADVSIANWKPFPCSCLEKRRLVK